MSQHPLADYPRPPPRGEDLPYSDGEPMESGRHFNQLHMLVGTLSNNSDPSRPCFVGGNMFVYFSETQAKKNDFRGPDVFVVLGKDQRARKSWVVWEEDGKLPDVVIELLSPKTEHVDRGEKFRIYRDVWKVSRYYLFDPYTFVFEGYALEGHEYLPIAPNAEGRLECAPLGLELGLHDTLDQQEELRMLRWFEPSGALLPSGSEVARTAEAKAVEAEAKAAEAEAKVVEAEAKAVEARAEVLEVRTRADEAQALAQQAQSLADEAQARADALAAKVAALEAKLSAKGE